MGRRNPFIEDIRAIVLNNYTDEQFGVSELVDISGKSRSQLHRKVKSATGKSLTQFIREIRLDTALKILKEEDVTASEVAYQVGFNSPTYFNTCFNEYFGYPPGEVKLRMEHEDELPGLSETGITGSQRNSKVLIWLVIVTLMVVTALTFNYFSQASNVATEALIEKPKTIAVLPFKNWSGDPELEYVSDGMTDAVITRLAGISEIERVVPYSTVVNYKHSEKPTAAIAEELNVEFILEGNFKMSGNRVMSNLNLIEVRTSKYLWTLEYKGAWRTDEIFEMQAQIAENVAKYMRTNVSESERVEMTHIPTDNETAYLTYLQANSLFNLLNDNGLKSAKALFEKAIALDSTFVEPYIGLANTYGVAGSMWGVMKEQDAWQLSKYYFDEALRIDSLKNSYHYDEIMSVYCFGKFMYELDFDCIESFIEKDHSSSESNNPFYYFIQYRQKTGDHDSVMELWDRSLEMDPNNHYHQMGKAISYFFRGDYQNAVEIFSILDPHFTKDYFYLLETAKFYYYMGEMDKSKLQLDRLLDSFEARPPIVHWLQAVHKQTEGEENEVNDHLKSLKEFYENEVSGSPAWFMALYYCHIEDYDQAFIWLNRSYERHEVEMTWFKEEPMLRPVKDDPRYVKIYKKIGFDRFDKTPPTIN